MPVIPALGRLRSGVCESETSLGYIARSRPAEATYSWQDPISKKEPKKVGF
jgi:hypothetical protein